MSDFIPNKRGLSRVFIIPGGARPDHAPVFMSCMRAQAQSKEFGDVEDIEAPHMSRPGAFVKIGEVQGADGRAQTTLEGRYALDIRSELLKWAKLRCPVDVHLHWGDCEDLSDFNSFKKIAVYEEARLTSWETDEAGALQSDDEASILESAPISGRNLFEYVPLNFSKKAEDLTTKEITDVIYCDDPSCGNCADESDGCKVAFAVTIGEGGSPGTPPDILYTLDGGLTWYAHDIEELDSAQDARGVACLGSNVVVISEDANSLVYAPLTDFDGEADPEFEEVTTGFEAGGAPNAIWSVGNKAWIVGAGGHIYVLTDPSAGVTVQDNSIATISDYKCVHAISRYFAIAGGDGGVIAVTEDGETWALSPSTPVGVGTTINAIYAKTKKEWFIGTDGGQIYYTLDGGQHWTEATFPGSGSGEVEDIVMANSTVMYVAHTTAGNVGRVLASFNGGYDFVVLPQMPGLLPGAEKYSALAACAYDPDKLIAVGIDDDGSTGIITLGTD